MGIICFMHTEEKLEINRHLRLTGLYCGIVGKWHSANFIKVKILLLSYRFGNDMVTDWSVEISTFTCVP
jgi:hypothetical protein